MVVYREGAEPPTVDTLREHLSDTVSVHGDDGPAFDPLAAQAPDTTLGLDERPVGGLGLMLVRRLMDDVAYERRDGRNHLRLRRRLVPVEA